MSATAMGKGARRSVNVFVVLSVRLRSSMFFAPLMLAPETVHDLDGNANMIDYGEMWDDLPIFPRIVYYFGDFNCHQKAERSFEINNNQMPVWQPV